MKNKKLSFAISTILGVFALSTVANAELVIKTSTTKTEAVVKAPVVATLPSKVVAKEAEPKVSGFGNDIPLDQALQQMLPTSDWKVVWNGTDAQVSSLKAKRVSWSEKDTPLDDAVANVSKKASHTNASVDYALKIISVREDNSPALASVAPAPKLVAPASKGFADVTPEKTSVSTRVPAYTPVYTTPTAPIVETWDLDPSLTLKQNVTKWAKKANYNVVWEGADYRIYGSAVFTGAFDSEDGPVVKVLSAYEHSDQPLKAKITVRDHVLFVHNKNWDMPTVIPINSNDQIAPDINGNDAPAVLPDISKERARTYDPYTASQNNVGGKSVSQP